MNELELYATHYYKLGLNVTRMGNSLNVHNFYNKNLLKTPDHSFKNWFSQRQSIEEFNEIDWSQATGVGTTAGYNRLVTIDIDGTNDYEFLESILKLLCLPKNYEWVTVSGSKNGFHILVFTDKFFTTTENEVVTTFKPNSEYDNRFEKIEFLWHTNVVLPPSLHNSGNYYNFLNCKFPLSPPQDVNPTYIRWSTILFLDTKCIPGHDDYTSTTFQLEASKVPSDIADSDFWKAEGGLSCVIDIETDGLIVKTDKKIVLPNIVQVAWLMIDGKGTVYKKFSSLLSGNFDYNSQAFDTNKINKIAIDKIGNTPTEILKLLIADLKISNCAVFHNSDFDLPILQNEIFKSGLQNVFKDKQIICTMKTGTDYCRIESGYGDFKYPKLTELYENLFGYEIIQHHNAESDVLITAKCFRAMRNLGLIIIDNLY